MWRNSSNNGDVLFTFANNKEEYRKEIGLLTKPYNDVWKAKCLEKNIEYAISSKRISIPIEDYEEWHDLFTTKECKNLNNENFTNPTKYKDYIGLKPSEEDYPVMLMYELFDKEFNFFSLQDYIKSIK